MENKNQNSKEKEFNTFLNKTIILSSKQYYRNQMNHYRKETTLVDNEEYSALLHSFCEFKGPFAAFESIENSLELKCALSCLSDIEQAVIFLLFNEELSQGEASKILKVYSKTISKIKKRAITKLKKYLEGDF